MTQRISLYAAHVDEWRTCTRCNLHKSRNKVCLARGSIPADILFVGEAPGESENIIGRPFVGPAGQLLDHIIRHSVPSDLTYCITNLVGCIPYEDDSGKRGKAGQPSYESIEACAPRLQSFIEIVHPSLIVCVGSLARDHLDPKFQNFVKIPASIATVAIKHPAALLRINVVIRGLMIQTAIVTIQNAIEAVQDKAKEVQP